jgi:hypothetical protein
MLFQNMHGPRLDHSAIELRSYSLFEERAWAYDKPPGADDSILLKAGQTGPMSFHPLTSAEVFCKLAVDASPRLLQSEPLQESWDFAKARLWLEICKQCHHSLCGVETIHVPDMNLIDCEDRTIVEANETTPWLALSYVWGAANQHQSPLPVDETGYRKGSRLPELVPRVIQDAMTVTKQLGYRCLWVDEYCIDQSNLIHLRTQINNMGQIYQGADVTIVAAAGEDKQHGLPGVGETKRVGTKSIRIGKVVLFSHGPEPREQAQSSKWFSRGS